MSMERIINNYILPENENDSERAERLVTVVSALDERQKLAFTALVRKQQITNDNIQKYVKLCEDLVSFNCVHFYFHQILKRLYYRWVMSIKVNTTSPKPTNSLSILEVRI